MTSRPLAVALAFTALTAGAGPALAQPSPARPAAPVIDDEPQPHTALPVTAPPPALPDSALQALRGQWVAITERNGAVIVGQVLGFDPGSVTLALAPSRDVVTLPRAELTRLQLAESPPSAPPLTPAASPASVMPPPPPAPPQRKRYFGLQLGVAPSVEVDLEVGHFYGFGNADFVLPTADTNLLGFSVGGGVTFGLGSRSNWKMDIFAHINVARLNQYDGSIVGGGVGMGFHYTASNGLTFGFKIPLFGYSGYAQPGPDQNNSSGVGVAFYYLSSVMSLPVFSIGYRF